MVTRRRLKRWKVALLAGCGGFMVIAALAAITSQTHWALLMGSFGSSAVILFGFPDSGFSKPNRVVGAHVLCAAIGIAALQALGPAWWSQALAVGLCISLMLGLRLVHPPAGSNPLLVFALGADWHFLLFPALFGSLALVSVAWIWRRMQGRLLGESA